MKKQKNNLFFWVVCGLVCLFIFVAQYEQSNLVPSFDLRVGREQAIELADAFLKNYGFDPEAYNKSISFGQCDTTYLQRTIGMQEAKKIFRDQVPCWRWRVRYYKELQKDGLFVSVNAYDGKIVYFRRSILEDEEGENLSQEEAQEIAEAIFTAQGENINKYLIGKTTSTQLKNRKDHAFTWMKKGVRIGDASIQVAISIAGDSLKFYSKYLRTPEQFWRDLAKKETPGRILSLISSVLTALLFITALFCLVFYRKRIIRWKFAFGCGIITTPILILVFFNSLPFFWFRYVTTYSKNIFLFFETASFIAAIIFLFIFIFVCAAAGELMSRIVKHKSMPIIDGIMRKKISFRKTMPRVVIGYSLGFWWLGYVTLFYTITSSFGIWQPLYVDYSDMLTSVAPFLYPLAIALIPALGEEFLFRLFAISFFRRHLKVLWLAVLIPALIWAFGHSSYPIYPTYIRAVELSLVGIVLGIAYLRYGIETVIIAHYVYNAVIAGMLLLRSGNTYFVVSGIIVVIFLFFPVLAILFWGRERKGKNKRIIYE